MNNRFLNLLAAVFTLLLMLFLVGYFADAVTNNNTIRLAHDSKVNSPLHVALLDFERQVEKDSRGEIQIELYSGGQLGGVRETTEMVRQGNLQMTVGASVLLTSIVPEFNVLDMFYLFRDIDHAHRSLDHPQIGGLLLDAMASKGLKGLGYMEVGFRSITSSKRHVESLQDIEGLKIRAASNPVQIEAWKSLGAAPTPLSWGEIFTSLQQGLINTQESAIYSVYAERFYEAQQYLSLTDHIYTNYVLFANKAFWDGLSPKHQLIVNRALRSSIERQRLLANQQNQKIIAELKQYGMQVNRVDDAVRLAMKHTMNDAVMTMLRTRTGGELFDRVMREIEAIAPRPVGQNQTDRTEGERQDVAVP